MRILKLVLIISVSFEMVMYKGMALLILFVRCLRAQEDCRRNAYNPYNFYGSCYHYFIGTPAYFECGPDHTCCENGCCQTSSEVSMSDMETAGVVLSATALFTIIILALMIFGATYSNSKENEGHLFNKDRKTDRKI
ncbi:hypothetical protein ACJMK2_019146 [Sinanodonta woodiana]|uniref:Uncharacterized protein n=1 Tax=Sinanodonta woodiana TaxID=1069815 RepID=A0ABD3UIK9_SINWO